MSKKTQFTKAYYDRHYKNPKTRVRSANEFNRLGHFVCAYVKHLGVPVRRVLDLGCGLGGWHTIIEGHYPAAKYTGVEVSEYLCGRYGWHQGSIVDYTARTPFDLVICQDVIQYLNDDEATRAMQNLAKLCRGVLYFFVPTSEDWDSACDRARTDRNVYFRSGDWYRRRLRADFVNVGGGVFVCHDADVVLFDLEAMKYDR